VGKAVRSYSRILISILALLLPGYLPGLNAAQAQSSSYSSRLDDALRKGDLERARDLVLDDQDGADELFLRYLEETLTQGQPQAGEIHGLERARRLADVFFRIYELDFERGIVSYWEKATPTQKQELLPILRDHFAAYKEAREISRRMPQPIVNEARLREACLALAGRYRKVSFGKGELQAMLWAESLGSYNNSWKEWQLAKNLGDEVAEAWAAYYFGSWAGEGQAEFAAQHAVEAAERLHLPKLLQFALARMAWRVLSRDDYAAHLDYLRRGLETVRTIPVRQSMVSRSGCDFYPEEAWYLKTLWRAYKLRDIPEGRAFFEQGRAMSRRYGGEPGELAYLVASMQEFIRPGVFKDVASQAELLARRMGHPGWLASFLMAKARGLEGTREFPEAFAALEEAAEIYKKLGDRGHLAECLEERAFFQIQTNEIDRAVDDYAEAIKIDDELGLKEAAIVLRGRAGSALQSQPKLALKFLNEALPMAEKIDAPGIIRSVYSARAKVLATDSPAQSLEDFKKELFYCERHRENIGYPGEVPVAMRLVSQAMRRVGKYGEAVEMEKRRAEFCHKEGLFNAEADAYYWLANIYCFDLGEPRIAADFAEKYTSSLIWPGRRLTVNYCDRIAGVYLSIGQPGRALEYWAKALQLAEETPAGEHLERMLHINVAKTYLDLGDYDAAMKELEAEKALIERTFYAYREPLIRVGSVLEGNDATIAELSAADGQAQRKFQSYDDPIELQKANWLNRCALALALSGNLARAVEASRQAIELEFSIPPGTALADYYAYFTPGDALAQAGRLDEAIDFYKKRRSRAREIKSLPGEREALLKLGAAFAQAGKPDDARRNLQEAVRIDRQPPGPDVGRLAESLLALGKLEHQVGNLPRAEELLVEARKTANPYDLNQIWQVERALAAVSVARNKHDQAENHFELAISSLEGARERLRPEEFALRFGTDRLQVYDEYASYLAGRAVETGEAAVSGKAMLVVERRRAQALWDLMALGWARLPPDAVPEQLQRVRQAEARLTAKQGILRDQFNLPPEKRNSTQISQLEAELKEVQEEHAHLLTALAQGQFRFSSPSSLPHSLIADVRNKLGPDPVLIEYLVGDESTYAFVLSSAGLKISQLPAGRQKLRTQVQGLLQPFYRLNSGELDLARLGFDFSTAHDLYRQLIAPLESQFGKASRILVVPDDALFYLPLELLVDAIPGRKQTETVLYSNCEQAGFLIRRFTISYLIAAAQVLNGQMSSEVAGAAVPALLALANPTSSRESGSAVQEDPVRRRLVSQSSGGAYAPLPGTMDEIALIRKYFPASRVTVLTGSGATEANYKALSSRSGIIHLATHAIAADDQPFYSTLILAPEDGQKQEDGFLQAYEIVRSPLRAKLVVLSACETARGPLSRGEGLVGLVSAFLQAGARSVLATQWGIDESAAELMAAFYKAMTGGQDTAGALRQAKLEILNKRLHFGETEVSLAHPFFWAAFVLIGNGN
jgi:CHAT domain-containing protein